MSEEEIMQTLKQVIDTYTKWEEMPYGFNKHIIQAIQGLLDLYNKEKEKSELWFDKAKGFERALSSALEKLEEEKEKNYRLYYRGAEEIKKYYQDKIKDKIKELENKKEQYAEMPLIYEMLKNQLEELLGE